MKTKTWVLLLAALLLVCGVLSVFVMLPKEAADSVQVWSDGKLLHTLPLGKDAEVTVESAFGTNVVTVKDGKAGVTHADCPDGYCMARGMISGGTQIVCLPNRLVLKFTAEQTVDGVAG